MNMTESKILVDFFSDALEKAKRLENLLINICVEKAEHNYEKYSFYSYANELKEIFDFFLTTDDIRIKYCCDESDIFNAIKLGRNNESFFGIIPFSLIKCHNDKSDLGFILYYFVDPRIANCLSEGIKHLEISKILKKDIKKQLRPLLLFLECIIKELTIYNNKILKDEA